MLRAMSLVAAVAVALAFSTPAQAVGGLHGGIKGGVSFANQSTDVSASELKESRKGGAVGGWIQIPVAPFMSIQPEAFFATKGGGVEVSGVTENIEMEYVEVPVLVKFGFAPPAAPAKPSLFAGPSLGVTLGAKSITEGSGSSDGELDIKESVTSTDFGFVFGAGLEFGSVGVDVRYTKGLSNVNDSGSGEEVKNNVFSVMGSLRFF